MPAGPQDVVTVVNREGAGPCLLVCDHASNRMPDGYGTLGLPEAELENHTAWDPGALAVAEHMADLLDAPLVASNVSRLVIDCNRAFDAANLIPETAEGRRVPGNSGLDPAERARRIRDFHAPFHAMIDAVLRARRFTAIVSVHSFTPVFFGATRPWDLGLLHDEDSRIADAMLAGLAHEGLTLGRNQPYSPADGVYYTLARHGTSRGLAAAMIEIRNDRIRNPQDVRRWAEMLASALREALKSLPAEAETAKGGSLA